ncbi:uroporphyrinogen-III synthase [Oceanicella actignis]|uniref:Uroporphyrinogen-III synthase n=1 Tax=Oceanicella actignis TaxID=1189325 RepID=A0A1M7TFN7_9RHOB|nr:uroporphyrinogen-III synthase [Oceanicella actignis]SET60936.1 uroporphyrinogen-III synthase [Oceanicella actignis]SHN69525.1 uroporphyrinogen-III synthase [Oceanicella actignis]
MRAPPLLVVRARPEAERDAEALSALGWRAIPCPVSRFVPTAEAPDWASARALALTSAKALRAVRPCAGALALPVWCVGPATAAAARAAGFRDVREGGGDGAALAARMLAAGERGPVLHLRGAEARAEPARSLRAAGVEVIEAVVYRMQACEALPEPALRALAEGGASAAVYSPRGAALLAQLAAGQAGAARLAGAARQGGAARLAGAAAISPAAAAPLAPLAPGLVEIAARPDGAAMRDAAARLLDRIRASR